MKKGFSIVELLVSITLISTIILLLFQVIVSLKSLYTKDSTNTSMLVNQASVSYLINSHLEEKGFKEADNCVAGQVDCITITYLDNTIEEVKVDSNSNTIKIGNKLYKYPTGTTISLPIVDKELIDSDTLDYDTIFKLKINVSNKLFKNKDYNINIVHVFEDAPIVPTVPAKVYGLRWDGNTTYTRLEDAVGMKAKAGVGTTAVTNDFDNAEIYKDIVDVTVDGNVFVKIPKFYIKKLVTGDTWEWYVSKDKKDNAYYLPECFKDEEGNELDYVLIGKYDASLNGTFILPLFLMLRLMQVPVS